MIEEAERGRGFGRAGDQQASPHDAAADALTIE
jgi:hypothetical protein